MLNIILEYLPASWIQVGLLVLTVLVYIAAREVYLRSGSNPFLIPVLTSVILIVALLIYLKIPYESYAQATKGLQLLIGPATVALAIPLYNHLPALKRMWLPLVTSLVVGGVTAILSVIFIVWFFGGSMQTVLSIAGKSATMPVSIPASEAIGGLGSLAAIAAAVTGISGVLIAAPLFRIMSINDELVQGFTLGLTAHAIGTARVIQISQNAAALAALAMGLNGLLTAALMPFVPLILKYWPAF